MSIRLSEHAAVLGKAGARKRWEGTSDSERKKIMALVRAGKRKPVIERDFGVKVASR